jgi:bisphosphoglycerate-dependent phosphoglycerate mutase
MIKYLILFSIVVISGCASVSTTQRPASYYTPADTSNNEPLFGADGGTLVDQEIERILNYRLVLPEKNRIAILKLSSENNWRNYSSDFTQLSASMASDFVGALKKSPRVYDASFLPSMLVPQQRTVPYLREAAARYQADLLLAYRTSCRSFEKYKLLNPNETKAYCTVEVVMLDVRSGIVPFTMVSSQEFSAQKAPDDTNFRETIKKAEMESISNSLKEVAERVKQFMLDIEQISD